MKNKYVEHAHVPERKVREMIRYFAVDLDASQMARLTGLSRNTVNRYLKALRQRIVEHCDRASPFDSPEGKTAGEFGVRAVSENPRGRNGKTIVFGILSRDGRIYTEIVPESVGKPLQAVVRGRIAPGEVIDWEAWRGYCGVVDVASGRHQRIDVGRECSGERLQINAIEGFWGYAKNRLVRYRGMKPEIFNLHLKEYEFRYNHRGQEIYPLLLKIVRNRPLKLR